MSIVFRPTIPSVFIDSDGATKSRKVWHSKVVWKFVNLRALSVPIEECAAIVGHTLEDCLHVIEERNLQDAINTRRHVLIKDVMR